MSSREATMGRAAVLVAAVTGAAGTVTATVWVPWSSYAGSVLLWRFPGWWWYVAAAAVLHLLVAWRIVAPAARQLPAVVELLAVAATVVAAVLVMRHYDDAAAFFDGPVPLVVPMPGLGGPLAILSALVSAMAFAFTPWQDAAATTEASHAR